MQTLWQWIVWWVPIKTTISVSSRISSNKTARPLWRTRLFESISRSYSIIFDHRLVILMFGLSVRFMSEGQGFQKQWWYWIRPLFITVLSSGFLDWSQLPVCLRWRICTSLAFNGSFYCCRWHTIVDQGNRTATAVLSSQKKTVQLYHCVVHLRVLSGVVSAESFVIVSLLEVLLQLSTPYSRIQLSYLADELHISINEVVVLLVELILDGVLPATIDEINGTLIANPPAPSSRCPLLVCFPCYLRQWFRSFLSQAFTAVRWSYPSFLKKPEQWVHTSYGIPSCTVSASQLLLLQRAIILSPLPTLFPSHRITVSGCKGNFWCFSWKWFLRDSFLDRVKIVVLSLAKREETIFALTGYLKFILLWSLREKDV